MKRGSDRPIIVVRKRRHAHAGHHGGAWKVAYADFVTAMMAFFMVMWIIGMDQHVRDSIEGYFSNPVGFKKGYTAGKSPLSSGSSPGTVQTASIRMIARASEERDLTDAGNKIQQKLEAAGLSAVGQDIEIVKTSTGLRIELAENATGDQYFATASAAMTDRMQQTLTLIAQELGPLLNPIILEGHTDAAPYSGGYSN